MDGVYKIKFVTVKLLHFTAIALGNGGAVVGYLKFTLTIKNNIFIIYFVYVKVVSFYKVAIMVQDKYYYKFYY